MQIYRVWMIYGRSWLIITLPILLTIATAGKLFNHTSVEVQRLTVCGKC